MQKLIFILISLVFIGCAPSSDYGTGTPAPPPPSENPGDADTDPTPTIKTENQNLLDGTWVSNCVKSDDSWYRGTMIFKAPELSNTYRVYSDSKCTTKTGELPFPAKFIIGQPLKDVPNAFEIDITYADDSGADITVYNIFKNSSGKLFFGSENGISLDTRPNSFDMELAYAKQ